MTRTSRLFVLLGLLTVIGLALPSDAFAQRRGSVRGRPQVAVPRTHPPIIYRGSYSRPYFSRPFYGRSYFYRPYYYARYYPYRYYRPYYYSPYYYAPYFGFGFGIGLSYGSYWNAYGPSYPYASAYPAPYPYSYPYPYTGASAAPPSYAPPYAPQTGVQTTRPNGDFGTLSLRVMPSDATILVDGEVWERPTGEDRFSIDLVAGPHRLEVRRQGYVAYQRMIDVVSGRTVTLNVGLTTGGTIEPARTVPLRNYR